MAPARKPAAVKVTIAQAIRDVLITAMNKGQLPLLCVCAVLFLLIWRLPTADVSALGHQTLQRLVDWSLIGWLLAIALMFGWWFHAKSTRDQFKSELARIGQEKSRAQNAATGGAFSGGSNRRR